MSHPLPTRPLLPWTGNGDLAMLVQTKAMPLLRWERDIFSGYDSLGRNLGTFPMVKRFDPIRITDKHGALSLKIGDECVVSGIRFFVTHISNVWVKRYFWGIDIETTFTIQAIEVPRQDA